MTAPAPGQTVVIYTRGSEPPVVRVYATAAEARAAIQRAEGRYDSAAIANVYEVHS